MTHEEREIERLIEVVARMIPKEHQSRDFYAQTAAHAPTPVTRQLFEHLADQAAEHEMKLKAALRVLQTELEDLRARAHGPQPAP